MRDPYVGERVRLIAASAGNQYQAEDGTTLIGMEGPYADDVIWDKPFTGWGTFDRNAAHKARQPQRLTVDPAQLQTGDIIRYVTHVAEDEKGRPVVVVDIERPPA